jgi:uncharacterized YigZ family protein
MYTIKKNVIYQYEIKKSKFITLLYQVNDVEKISDLLQNIKKIYKDATHYCYAYKIENIQKFSDDGEPGGTAGLPIMEVLNKKNLNNILCVVVRSFGGIKLGAGGLVRAYSKAVRDATNQSEIMELMEGYLIKIEVNYDEQKQFEYLYKDKIKKKEFNELVTYYIEIEKDNISSIQNYEYQKIKECLIEKK